MTVLNIILPRSWLPVYSAVPLALPCISGRNMYEGSSFTVLHEGQRCMKENCTVCPANSGALWVAAEADLPCQQQRACCQELRSRRLLGRWLRQPYLMLLWRVPPVMHPQIT